MDALNAGRTDADHYDAEDLTSPKQWEIDDLKMSTFTAAYEQLKGFFDDNSL